MSRENKGETIEIAGDQRLWKLAQNKQHVVGEGIMCLERAVNQRVKTQRCCLVQRYTVDNVSSAFIHA